MLFSSSRRGGAKTAPSVYPRIPFHGLRAVQLLSSVIVGGIMSYFMYHLTHDHWPTPWTFIFLMASSLFSIAALTFTICLHCFVGLKSDLNIGINGFNALLWTLSWSLLTWYMSPTLKHTCDVENWREDVGIMVCRIYKALFAFAFLGMISTIAALLLDFYVRGQSNRRGIYKLHDLDSKASRPRPEAPAGPFTDPSSATYGSGGLAEPRESEAWDAPRMSMGPYSEEKNARSGDLGLEGLRRGGYGAPEEQHLYAEDTGYHGGHLEKP
ncbi:hypothetical protein B0A48_01475 [Cryoendolithus antarcticus]|uniref:MARVEL domain-containing protein n=1 Tax=Cryoendolithus antarcticus TaxID=1507870 RepID=A0A1V8TPE5_9PEZI|nr:hypothetical protein B0A48_01475 [Cryoendolithus antarcticus]